MNYETTKEIEIAVAEFFGVRKNVIVSNVFWGMFPYELDLCILNKGFYATEVEIKISKSDLKADSKKWHRHDQNYNYIKYLWFAMPEKMKGCEDMVPQNAGIFFVSKNGFVNIFRKPISNKLAKKWDMEKAFKLGRLGSMRTWDLKWKLLKKK